MARLPCSTHHAHTVTRSPTAAATATAAHKNPPSTPSTTTTKPHPTPQQQQQLRRILKTIDPYGAHAHALAIQQRLRSRRREALAPDFDVRETASAFYLEGELPGIGDRDAVRLDWIDRRTLSVEATIEKVDLEVEWGLLRPIRVSSVGLSSSSSSTSSAASTSSASDHGEDMAVDEEHDEDAGGKGIEAQPSKPEVREWLSERRTGHYQRTFTFPTDVDASAIRARLGQGLLRVLVPKVVRKGGNQTQVNIEDCE